MGTQTPSLGTSIRCGYSHPPHSPKKPLFTWHNCLLLQLLQVPGGLGGAWHPATLQGWTTSFFFWLFLNSAKFVFLFVCFLFVCLFCFVLGFFLLFFLVPHSQHMEVPRLGVQSELQLPAYATATQDPSHICNLHHSSRQCRILNPLSKARDLTCNLMVPNWIRFCCAMMGTPHLSFFLAQDSNRKSHLVEFWPFFQVLPVCIAWDIPLRSYLYTFHPNERWYYGFPWGKKRDIDLCIFHNIYI